jgi:AAA family ATP:ADP antiporter
MQNRSEFTGFRSIFWPIHRNELKHFFLMSSLMFSILFNQNILRILKDSILISDVGVEVTNFAKIYGVIPASALFIFLYSKMTDKYSFSKIFRILTITFLTYFLLFAFLLYPYFEYFHFDERQIKELMCQYPSLKWYIAMVGYWSMILFYVLSELWPNIFYIILFWQLANNITKTNDAKRFYTLFALFGNSSLLLVGYIVMHLSEGKYFCNIFNIKPDKYLFVQNASLLIIVFGITSVFLVEKICQNFNQDKAYIRKGNKTKFKFIESMKYILSSKYLWLILICSASFGLSLTLVESIWKDKIKKLYPTVNEYANYNSKYIIWTGIAILLMTIIGNNIMRRNSWIIGAIISPILIMISGIIFFALIVFEEYVPLNIFSMSPLVLAVFIGAIQNVISKGTKYSIWDTSREMLFIPLNQELKVKGKAAVDMISSKLGKSFGSLSQSLLFTIYPTATYSSISGILGVIFTIVCLFWITSLVYINRQYNILLSESDAK